MWSGLLVIGDRLQGQLLITGGQTPGTQILFEIEGPLALPLCNRTTLSTLQLPILKSGNHLVVVGGLQQLLTL